MLAHPCDNNQTYFHQCFRWLHRGHWFFFYFGERWSCRLCEKLQMTDYKSIQFRKMLPYSCSYFLFSLCDAEEIMSFISFWLFHATLSGQQNSIFCKIQAPSSCYCYEKVKCKGALVWVMHFKMWSYNFGLSVSFSDKMIKFNFTNWFQLTNKVLNLKL